MCSARACRTRTILCSAPLCFTAHTTRFNCNTATVQRGAPAVKVRSFVNTTTESILPSASAALICATALAGLPSPRLNEMTSGIVPLSGAVGRRQHARCVNKSYSSSCALSHLLPTLPELQLVKGVSSLRRCLCTATSLPPRPSPLQLIWTYEAHCPHTFCEACDERKRKAIPIRSILVHNSSCTPPTRSHQVSQRSGLVSVRWHLRHR